MGFGNRGYSEYYDRNKQMEQKLFNVIRNETQWNELKNNMVIKEGINDFNRKRMFNSMLDNERKYLLTESANMSYDVAKVQKVVMPLVRRFWPRLLATELVSTQPLEAPTGFIRKLKVNYQNTELPGIVPSSDQNIPQATVQLQTAGQTGSTESSFTQTGLETKMAIGGVSISVDGTEVQTDDGMGKIIGTYESKPVLGQVDYENGIVNLYFVEAVPSDVDVDLDYQTSWETQTDADFTGREVTFEIENSPIIVTERKLRAKWMPEFWEDVSQIDGIDAQVEMYNNVQNIISQEINSSILNELYQKHSADLTKQWDKTQPTSGFYGTRKDWYETIMITINELQATMSQKTNITEPNILVCHPSALAIIRSQLANYGMTDIKPLHDDTTSMGYKSLDVNGGTYKIYSTNLVDPAKILVVYKGSKIEESGYVYQPFVPLTAVPYTESTGKMGIVFHTRYGKEMYRPDWFGEVDITES